MRSFLLLTIVNMRSDTQFSGAYSEHTHVETTGFLGAGNNPMVGMTVNLAVAVPESLK